MKYCGKCGQQASNDEERLCSGCGAALPVMEESATLAMEQGELSTKTVAFEPATGELGGNAGVHLESSNLASSSVKEKDNYRSGMKRKMIIGSLLAILVLAFGGLWSWKNYGTEARAQAKLDLGIKYLSENDYEKAVLAFDEAIKIDPKEIKCYQGLAKTYTLQGKYDDAKAVYEKGTQAVKPEYQIVMRLSLAGMYIDKGDLPQAETLFQEIINSSKTCVDAYIGLSLVYQQQGGKEKILAVLEQCVMENSQDYRAYNALGKYYADNIDKEKALQNVVKSLDLEVNQQEPYLILEVLYKGNWTELTSRADQVTGSKTAAMLKYYAYYSDRNYLAALSLYRNSLERDENNLKAHALAARCQWEMGQHDEATKIIKAISARTLNEWIMGDLASCLLLTGDEEQALFWARKCLILDPGNIEMIKILSKISGQEKDGLINITRLVISDWVPINVVKQELSKNDLLLPGILNIPNISSGDKPLVNQQDSDIKNDTNQVTIDGTKEDISAGKDDNDFEVQGIRIDMDKDAILKQLGSPKKTSEIAYNSHLVWTYDNIEIQFLNGRVHEIVLCNGNIATTRGLRIGDPESKAKELYGDRLRQYFENQFVYSKRDDQDQPVMSITFNYSKHNVAYIHIAHDLYSIQD